MLLASISAEAEFRLTVVAVRSVARLSAPAVVVRLNVPGTTSGPSTVSAAALVRLRLAALKPPR